MGFAKTENQVCLAHLIRDVQYAIDASDDVFALGLRHLLSRTCRTGRRRDKLADSTLKTYAARLESSLDEIMAHPPTHPAGVKPQRMMKKIHRLKIPFRPKRSYYP